MDVIMFDPIKLEIYKSLFTAITDEMGIVLQKSAFSSNIKERRDFSCALFDQKGDLVIQAAHIPVHLGSMQLAVKETLKLMPLYPNDIVMTNDPYTGGTHLPDITLITPFFEGGNPDPLFYLANRAHHADVGGMTPGSMPLSTSIYQEGLRIPPVKIMKYRHEDSDLMSLFLSNTRNREEREGDIEAQKASLEVGKDRLKELIVKYGSDEVLSYMKELQDYAERIMRKRISKIPDGLYTFQDYMDDDGVSEDPVKIAVQIKISDEQAVVDFTGSDEGAEGCINANLPIVTSAVFYVFRSIIQGSVPSNAGLMRPIEIITKRGSLVHAEFPSAIAGGNVETSQRLVDVLYGALSQVLKDQIPAASQGTMNNLTLGGYDPFRKREFSYYETIAGGMGGRPGKPGLHAVQSHMTNTLNTPIEALETTFPLEVVRYAIRKDSGGIGKYQGGDGIIREIRVLTATRGSILSDRRTHRPYGLHGGEDGMSGENYLIRKGIKTKLPSKTNLELQAGDVICIHTPGGGGHGKL